MLANYILDPQSLLEKAGNFICFEGIDLSGKTTLLNQFKSILEDNGLKVAVLKGIDDKGKELLSRCQTVDEELYVIIEFRKKQQKEIKKALQENDVLLMDRYDLSTLVNQCKDFNNKKKYLEASKGFYKPTFYVVLTADRNIIKNRAKAQKLDDLDKKYLDMDIINSNIAYVNNCNNGLQIDTDKSGQVKKRFVNKKFKFGLGEWF